MEISNPALNKEYFFALHPTVMEDMSPKLKSSQKKRKNVNVFAKSTFF